MRAEPRPRDAVRRALSMRRGTATIVLFTTGLLACGGASAAERATSTPDAAPRFDAAAALSPRARSVDGRFAVSASARFDPQRQSANGRFALKVIAAPATACGPGGDSVFGNGFEP